MARQAETIGCRKSETLNSSGKLIRRDRIRSQRRGLTRQDLRASHKLILKTHLFLDAQRWNLSAEQLFGPVDGSEARANGGRGRAVFFKRNGIEFVRKHYQRGGFVRRLVRDRYFYTGLAQTRMWREYRLLKRLGKFGLPVPEPVAAFCVYHGLFQYSGDLVTVRLAGAETLGTRLRREPLSEAAWAEMGAILARFHRHHVYHADLNIENILVGGDSGIALIDFDKGGIRPTGRPFWIRQNMQRLLRSLRKASLKSETFHFSMSDWQCLTARHEELVRQLIRESTPNGILQAESPIRE